jgi:protein-tyrosine-phosphatase
MNVLFICKGNICRSPIAEALLKALRPNWKVDSCGIFTHNKRLHLHTKMVQLAFKYGIRLNALRPDIIIILDKELYESSKLMLPLQTKCWDIEDPFHTKRFEEVYLELQRLIWINFNNNNKD